MRALDLTSLRLFVAVCEARSISRVAEEETIVVSAISKRLTQLERTVGAKLLSRGKRGVKPTPAGESLLQHAYDLREKIALIERDMSEHATQLRGQVRLFAPATAVAEFLPDDLASFLRPEANRLIHVDLEEHLSHQVVFGVRQGVAHLGICWDVVDAQGLQSREYRHDHLGVVAHRSHPLASRRKVAMRDTLAYDHIGARTSAAFQTALAQDPQRLDKLLRYRAQVGSFDAAIRLVHAGLGIAVVPGEMLRDFRGADELAFVPLSDSWAKRTFVLCAHNFDDLPPVARTLADHLAPTRTRA
jgi:DNA-binding transcriptional LysR family regulator